MWVVEHPDLHDSRTLCKELDFPGIMISMIHSEHDLA